jgi:hypothetical protein
MGARIFRFPAPAIFFSLCFLSTPVDGATYRVSSMDDLNSRISAAVAGDLIIVSNGIYTTSASIGVNRGGTEKNPMWPAPTVRSPAAFGCIITISTTSESRVVMERRLSVLASAV